MTPILAGLAMLGASIPTRSPWLGSRFKARVRGRGQRRPRGMTRLGESLAGWSERAPDTQAERRRVKKKCSARCFAGPNLSYPMCAKHARTCGIDCMGARAAFSRARQQKKPAIARKAVLAGKRAGCKWVQGKSAQKVLKGMRRH